MHSEKDIAAFLDACDKYGAGDKAAFDGVTVELDGEPGEIRKSTSKKFAGYTQADTKEELLDAIMGNLEKAGFFND